MLSRDVLSTSSRSVSTPPTVVKSADRVLAILDLLADDGPQTFVGVCDALDLPRSSAHGVLGTMERHGYVVRTAGVYALGRRVWEVAQSWGGLELRAIVRPPMEALAELTGETVQAAQLEGTDAHYIEVCESPHPVKLSSRPGARLPAHASGVGKCLLAALDPAEARRRLGVSELPPLTSRTLTDVDELLAELARVRKRGYATDDEEFALGLRCVAMPVRTPAGEVVAAVSVAMPEPRYNRAIATRNRAALAETVATIERLLTEAR